MVRSQSARDTSEARQVRAVLPPRQVRGSSFPSIPLTSDVSLSCSRPSLSTAKFSTFSPSSSFGDDKVIAPPAYFPRGQAPPSPAFPSPTSPARSEAWTHTTHYTSGLSDAELDVLLARCPSISTCMPSPRSPLEFGPPAGVELAVPVERPAPASIRAPSPAYSARPVSVSEQSRYSTRSSVVVTCAGSPTHATLSCSYEHYAV